MERSASEPDSAGYRGECAKRHDARYMNSDTRWLGTSSMCSCVVHAIYEWLLNSAT